MAGEAFVIVGASLAGAKAAEELRTQGFEGEIVLIGAESEIPYERPPLSKDYLRGESEREKAQVHPLSFYATHQIELVTAATVTAVDPRERTITLADGGERGYDRLLLATGSQPRTIDLPGADLDGVCYLRTLADCDVLRGRLADGGPLVVVGAGWIGSEVAASARQLGLDVTVIEPAAEPLLRVLGPELGGFYRDVHREHGVEMLVGTGVERFEGDGSVERVHTSDGRVLDCSFVVVGVGAGPRVELAKAAGLEVESGVLVDASLATSAPGVYAAGDIAEAWHPFFERRVRVEHWSTALNQGPAAARAMLGQDVSYDRLPYFFSDQYDVGMEYRGFAAEWDRVVVRGDPASREFIAFWLKDGRILAGMNVNVWDVGDPIEALIRSRAEIPVERLMDVETPLEELTGEAQK